MSGTNVREVMSAFDFEKVHRVMQLLDWKWVEKPGVFDGNESVPTIGRLATTALNLLSECANHPGDHFIATGGLVAMKSGNNLSLQFVVEESEVGDEENICYRAASEAK